MDVNGIIQIVSGLGFPVACCGVVGWYVKYISDNVFRIILTLVGTILLMFLNIKIVILVTGIILVIATVFISTYADKKLGLDPEEYTQKDIYIRK